MIRNDAGQPGRNIHRQRKPVMVELKHLLEMIRFSHTVFALPFALLGAVMAWTAPVVEPFDTGFRWRQLLGLLCCMVCARSAAMAFNRIADRQHDALNPRTERRHLPSGILSLRSVVIFTIVSSIGFVLSTLFFLPNTLPIYLALPVLIFLLTYSFTKRFTALAHFWLGAALMLAPISSWIAIRGPVLFADPLDMLPAFILGIAVLLWVSGFDIIYACQDIDFDRRAKLRSVPATLGTAGALRLAAVCHFGMVGVLAWLPFCETLGGPPLALGWLYAAAVLAVAGLLVYEHSVVRPNDLTRVNIAFFHVNAIVSIGLFVATTCDLLILPH